MTTVKDDGSLGRAIPRLDAHRAPGILHLAVSVQVLDPEEGWLLQRRASTKEAFADLWANTCCTHAAPGEEPVEAARRRVREELGLKLDHLVPAGVFTYHAVDARSGLVEYEVDHVFAAIGATAASVADPEEISELARLPFPAALQLVTSESGAPWAGEVLRRCAVALSVTT